MTDQQKVEAKIEAIKVAIRIERDQGSTKEDLIHMTVFDNHLIEEVYSE